jgi:hypothetical protein
LGKPEGSQSIGVEKIFVHPGWLSGDFAVNDVALLKLSKDITFNNFVQPVCVPSLGEKWIYTYGKNVNKTHFTDLSIVSTSNILKLGGCLHPPLTGAWWK